MTSPESKPPDVSSHAPLLERLRGNAFLPGVDYVSQSEVWMREAAELIESLLQERIMLNDNVSQNIVALTKVTEQLAKVTSDFSEYITSVHQNGIVDRRRSERRIHSA